MHLICGQATNNHWARMPLTQTFSHVVACLARLASRLFFLSSEEKKRTEQCDDDTYTQARTTHTHLHREKTQRNRWKSIKQRDMCYVHTARERMRDWEKSKSLKLLRADAFFRSLTDCVVVHYTIFYLGGAYLCLCQCKWKCEHAL